MQKRIGMDVGANIKVLMARKGLKQKYVAEKAGFNEAEFSKLLNGKRGINAAVIPAIATAIGCTPNDIFDISNQA